MRTNENRKCDISASFFNSETESSRNLDDSFYSKDEKNEISKVNVESNKFNIEITLDIPPEDMKFQKNISLTIILNQKGEKYEKSYR